MQDLAIAKKRLKDKNLTLCIAKNNKIIFETSSNGISGFLKAIENLQQNLEGASIADKIVGNAAALLCAYAKAKAVYATLLSKKAQQTLKKHGIYYEYDGLAKEILNIKKTGPCPFETLTAKISNPKDAYEKIKTLHESLSDKGRKMHGV